MGSKSCCQPFYRPKYVVYLNAPNKVFLSLFIDFFTNVYRKPIWIIEYVNMKLVQGGANSWLCPTGLETQQNAILIFITASCVISDGKVPVDETRKERKILTYSLVQLIIIGVFAVLGLIYSLGFLYFNISKRNHK